ncbi:zinc-ribbon domain containing protein [Chloroflexota bacterium]
MNQQQFRDEILHCCDCQQSFVFTAGEQAYFTSKGLSEPRRCKSCRDLRKRTLIPDPGVRR